MAKAYAPEGRHMIQNDHREAERPIGTYRSDYKQTNMPRVIITIVLLALLATLLVAGLFFNLTDFA